MTEKENEEVGFTKNNKRYSSCSVKRLRHAREKNKAKWKVRWIGTDKRFIGVCGLRGRSE